MIIRGFEPGEVYVRQRMVQAPVLSMAPAYYPVYDGTEMGTSKLIIEFDYPGEMIEFKKNLDKIFDGELDAKIDIVFHEPRKYDPPKEKSPEQLAKELAELMAEGDVLREETKKLLGIPLGDDCDE